MLTFCGCVIPIPNSLDTGASSRNLASVPIYMLVLFTHSYKQSLRRSAPVKIIEAPVRTYIPTSLPPGSVRAGPVAGNAPSIAGSDGRILYDWQGGHSIDTWRISGLFIGPFWPFLARF